MDIKKLSSELFAANLELAKTDGKAFRALIIKSLMASSECSVSTAATAYNNAKIAHEGQHGTIPGLGRPKPAAGVVRPGAVKTRKKPEMVADNDCFTVIELISADGQETVGRCQSFIYQGEAGETFDSKVEAWPNSTWVVISGLGPNHGEKYKLESGEKEVRRYDPPVEEVSSNT